MGLGERTLFNRVKASRQRRLEGADSKPVSAEQMEIARLRTELVWVKMACDILGKATHIFCSGHRVPPVSSCQILNNSCVEQGTKHGADG